MTGFKSYRASNLFSIPVRISAHLRKKLEGKKTLSLSVLRANTREHLMNEPSIRCKCPHINQSLVALKCNGEALVLICYSLEFTRGILAFKFVFTENVLKENTKSFWDWLIDQLCYWVLRNQHRNHPRVPDGLLAAEETLQHLLWWAKTGC